MITCYLIGSLRNPEIPQLANYIASLGYDVFADWHCAGERADDAWRDHEKARGRTYIQALQGYAARHVFDFDFYHINRAQFGVLALPAGRSAHIEMGYMIGKSKPVYVLLDRPDRWDCMYRFATGVVETREELGALLRGGYK